MIDYRQFINEGYDREDKADIVHDFAVYLKDNITEEENKQIWWAIGDGNGNYVDDRLTIGERRSSVNAKNTAANNEKYIKTVCFLVTDLGSLVAYLDAEDNELLRNSAMAEWKLGITRDQETAAFNGALQFVKNFFKDDTILNKHVDAAYNYYTDEEKAKLEKELERREVREAPFVWSAKKEQELATIRLKLRHTIAAIKYNMAEIAELAHEIDPVTGKPRDAQGIEALQDEINDLTLTKKRLIDTIDDYVYEKNKYEKLLAKHKNTREQNKYRDYAINGLGADKIREYILSKEPDATEERKAALAGMTAIGLAAGLTNDEINKLVMQNKPKRLRAIKTGDVKDEVAAKQKQKRAVAAAALKKFLGK